MILYTNIPPSKRKNKINRIITVRRKYILQNRALSFTAEYI